MALANRLGNVDVLRRERNAGAGFGEIDHRQSNKKSRGGSDLEKDERFESHAANFFQRARARDAYDDGRENQRRDDRLDQINENVAEKINFVSPFGFQPSDHGADHEADHDLSRQRIPICRLAAVGLRLIHRFHGFAQIIRLSRENLRKSAYSVDECF